MANIIRIKRRSSGNAGAPASLENAELAYNEVDDVLYYGKGTGGVGGTATTVEAIGGSGAYVGLSGTQTITGNKTFSGTVALGSSATATTQTSGDNSTKVATTAFVAAAISSAGSFTGFSITGDSGSSQSIASSDTITIAGGTGIDTVAGSTDTITINIDNTVATLSGTQELTNKTLTSPTVSGLYLSDSSITFEGSSADAYETTLTVANPTADRTLTLPNATDTLVGKATTDTFTNKTFDTAGTGNSFSVNGNAITSYVGSGNNVVLSTNPTITNLFAAGLTVEGASIVFEGATANDHETTLTVTDPTADRTLTLPDATGTIALTSDITTAINSVATSFTVAGDSGSSQTITSGSDTLTIAGGTGLSSVAGATDTVTINLDDTAVTAGSYGSSTAVGTFTVDAQGRLTAASSTNIRVASTSQTGIASFSSSDFAVSTGEVTIKSGGVDNAQLANSTITLGSSTLTLGSTTTSIAGITELTVDNININGNEISSTDTNGSIVLSPNGSGHVDVASSRIIQVAEPVDSTDAATKGYVDNKVSGLTWKSAVNLIATSNVALTGSTNTLVIDGHAALDSSDSGLYRLLLTAQSTGSQNGIYTYTDDGTNYSLVRSSDADVYTELIGASVYVAEGTTYQKTGWVQSNHYLTDFTGQNWVQFAGAGAYAAGDGLGLSGTTFAVNVAASGGIEIVSDALQLNSGVAGGGLTYSSGVIAVGGTADKITVNSDSITIASTYAGQSSITTVGTIGTGTWQGTAVGVSYGGTGATSASDARTNLGLAINTDVQAYSANLSAIAGLTSAANALPYFTGSGTAAVTTLSSFMRTVLDDADAATARTTLGVDTYTIDGGTF